MGYVSGLVAWFVCLEVKQLATFSFEIALKTLKNIMDVNLFSTFFNNLLFI